MNPTVIEAFNIMWQGMAGILVVMSILALTVAGLAKVGGKKN